MRPKHYYYRSEDLGGQAFVVTQLLERGLDGRLQNAPALVGRGRSFTNVEDLVHVLRAFVGGEVRLTHLREDQTLPSAPSSPH